jgi:hypothetical protein
MAAHLGKRKRTYNLRLIKMTWLYSVQEIAARYGLHKGTVLRWLDEGLRLNDDLRPYRIRGDELARFLGARQKTRKHKCRPNEFYCFKCREPREAFMGIADIDFEAPTRFRVKSICAVCNTRISKVQALRNLAKIQNSFHVQQLMGEHIPACLNPSVNTDSEVKT